MRTQKRTTTLPIGVISEGTLRTEDLLRAYVDALDGQHLNRINRNTVREVERRLRWDETYPESEEAGFDLERLTDILEFKAPPYAYFGTQEGDGACFGVWPDISGLEEELGREVVKVNDLSELPDDRAGAEFVMQVNDHGNVTLYRVKRRGWLEEVWSVV